ncbi:MAG: VCBS repeat-containing protein [Ignavibacteriales bacterium]|nr:VCBS repeat-containing protein [Ignavibacteriales bacterium]
MIIIPGKDNTFNCSDPSRRHRFAHVLSSTSFVFWLAIRTVSAQTNESAFGEVHFFPLPAQFEKSTQVSSNHQQVTTLALWSGHRGEILLATFDTTETSVTYTMKHTAVEFDNLYAADFNSDGLPDFMLVNNHEKLISFVLNLKPDSLQITSTMKIPFEPEQILMGDYNNDKHIDILVYARKTPGILPLIGNGKGYFTRGRIIAQDNAVGAADFAQVNNDNLTDIVLWDWVKSELHVLYGAGNGRFIDQSTFPVQGEVKSLTAISMIRDHALDLMLKMTKPSEFQVWEGNDFGDFQIKNHLPCEEHITDFCFVDVNHDGLNDIVMSTNPASLQVLFNNDIDAFTDRMEYASGDDPQDIVVMPQGNCIVFDRNGNQLIVYRNAAKPSSMTDSIQLATGVSPTEIIVNDFNRDSVMDIALLNTKSQSVSLYWGQKGTIPFGPLSYLLTGEPNHLAFHSSTDTTLQLVLTFPQTHQISYFTLDAANNSVSNAFIGCEGDAQLLSASINQNHQSEFVTWNTMSPEGNSLSFYEQLGPVTFIERTFRLLPPDFLLGASIADLNQDGFPGIIYAYRTGDTSLVELGVAYGDSAYSMKHRIVSREFALPDVKQVFIWLADFDNNGVLDFLMQAGSPVDYLMVAKGKGNGLFYDPKIITSGLPIEERSNLQIVDVDGDGFPDIVIGSQKLGRVDWFRNRGDCNFGADQTLATQPDLSHYAVADVDADGVKDLAMTLGKKGILKIINGKRLPFRSEINK